MTRIFDAEGKSIAASMVEAFPCVVSQIKNVANDGYVGVQISFEKSSKNISYSEFRLDSVDGYKKGDKIELSQFAAGDTVEVTGTGKGKGFAGTIKRHGFHRGPESHGGNNVREPGSIGAQQPQRVVLGRRMAGRMGGETATVKNLKVIAVEKNTILISGAIPGPKKGILRIKSK